MITPERLAEIETDPRKANIFKAEAKELADAYRERVPGMRVIKGADGAWLQIESPSGKKAAINLEALGVHRAGIVGATLLEWVDSLSHRVALGDSNPSCTVETELERWRWLKEDATSEQWERVSHALDADAEIDVIRLEDAELVPTTTERNY